MYLEKHAMYKQRTYTDSHAAKDSNLPPSKKRRVCEDPLEPDSEKWAAAAAIAIVDVVITVQLECSSLLHLSFPQSAKVFRIS